MLECVVNVSEGRRADVIAAIAAAAGSALLDVHTDADHHRSVLTLAGPDVEDAAFAVVAAAVSLIDLREHTGAHPRLGAADVVPFVPLTATMDEAVEARERVVARITDELGVPCVRYGEDGPSLPEVRRTPGVAPHPTAGICCVGARPVLVAYNLWLAPPATLDDAKRIAAEIRSPTVRALGLALGTGGGVQVSCNLVDPLTTGPDAAFDAVADKAAVARAELVGLVPAAVLAAIPEARWPELDLSAATTIEARLSRAGLDGGRFGLGDGSHN